MNEYLVVLIMIISSIIGAFGALLLKKAAPELKLKIKYLFNSKLISGIFLYFVAVIAFIWLLKTVDLSLLYPMTSMTYIFTIAFSVWLLKEKMNKYKWISITLIIMGNILINLRL